MKKGCRHAGEKEVAESKRGTIGFTKKQPGRGKTESRGEHASIRRERTRTMIIKVENT